MPAFLTPNVSPVCLVLALPTHMKSGRYLDQPLFIGFQAWVAELRLLSGGKEHCVDDVHDTVAGH